MNISQSAFDLIVREEVTGQEYYQTHYTGPEWPGGASGVTVGIGYDLGYASIAKIIADWGPLVSAQTLLLMQRCSGTKALAAQALLREVKAITVPWEAALAVFAGRDIPQWSAAVRKALPNCDKISLTCFGVLVSLAYNRGPSFGLVGDRYREMRTIRTHMGLTMFREIAGDILDMRRLWPTVKGLRDRREAEAALWVKGMAEPLDVPLVALLGDEPPPDMPLRAGPARTKPGFFRALINNLLFLFLYADLT